MRIKFSLAILLVLLLSACGAGVQQLELPAQRPLGKVQGKVLGGLFSQGTVSAYSLEEGASRQFIAKTDVNEQGEFNLEFASISRPILLAVSGGSFIDPDSLRKIKPEPDFLLSSIVMFESGKEQTASLTPLTHLVTGLVFFNQQKNKTAFEAEQLALANSQINELYSVDLNNKSPSITYQLEPKQLTHTGDEKHGLIISALSLLANKLSSEKQDALKDQYTLSTLTALMYEDIRADGILDGKSLQADSTEQKSLFFDDYPLDFNFYRTTLAQSVSDAMKYSSFTEFTGKAAQQAFIYNIATNNSILLADKNSKDFSNVKPEIKLLNDVVGVKSGNFAIDILVENVIELNEVKLFIDDAIVTTLVENPVVTTLNVDSNLFPDGEHQIKIVAVDKNNNEGSKQLSLTFDNTAPLVKLVSQPKAIVSGLFTVDFAAEDVVDLQQVKLLVDGALVQSIEKPTVTQFTLDTTKFDDGAYTLTIVAIDNLGLEGRLHFSISFDNSAPSVLVTSKTIVNTPNYLLQGEYNEIFSQIKTITVGDEVADILDAKNWSRTVLLSSGINDLNIAVEDVAGNIGNLTVTIILDDRPPTITNLDPIDTKFSFNNGTNYIEKLQLNNVAPLYIDILKLSLSGVEQSRASLLTAGTPFFEFSIADIVKDDSGSGIFGSNPEEIKAEYRYLINDVEIVPWQIQKLTISDIDAKLILSLASETLTNAWYKTSSSDLHKLELRATDVLGNQSIQQMEFHTQFYVPDVTVSLNSELPTISNGDFATRANYIGKEIVGSAYSLHNDTGRNYRIKLSDSDLHSLTQDYESVTRENKVQLRSNESWQRSTITSLVNCPKLNNDWQPVTALWNLIGGQYVKTTPKAADLEIVNVFADVPTAPPSTSWVNYQADDMEFDKYTNTVDKETLSYSFDYLFNYDLDGFITASTQPGMVLNWFKIRNNKEVPCDQNTIYAIQSKLDFAYIPINGYPRNNLETTQTIREFHTGRFRVFDEDNSEIINKNGWFEIPANHTVIIQKMVNAPAIEIYTDELVKASATIVDYNVHRLDKRLAWTINQNIIVDTQFNPEELLVDNANLKQQKLVNEGKIVVFDR